jgi:hypothetical protein
MREREEKVQMYTCCVFIEMRMSKREKEKKETAAKNILVG